MSRNLEFEIALSFAGEDGCTLIKRPISSAIQTGKGKVSDSRFANGVEQSSVRSSGSGGICASGSATTSPRFLRGSGLYSVKA